jgi:hypothetical protein
MTSNGYVLTQAWQQLNRSGPSGLLPDLPIGDKRELEH